MFPLTMYRALEQDFDAWLKEGYRAEDAAEACGVPVWRLYRWVRINPDPKTEEFRPDTPIPAGKLIKLCNHMKKYAALDVAVEETGAVCVPLPDVNLQGGLEWITRTSTALKEFAEYLETIGNGVEEAKIKKEGLDVIREILGTILLAEMQAQEGAGGGSHGK